MLFFDPRVTWRLNKLVVYYLRDHQNHHEREGYSGNLPRKVHHQP